MVPIDLSGKCALVTGASQGIGRACAEWIARAGASVALVARNEKNLEEAVSAIRAAGGAAEALSCDLTAPGKTEWAVGETAGRLGGLDILVCVAGVSRRSDPVDTTDEDIDVAIDLKLRSAVRLVRAAVPHMRARGGGSIVFTAGLGQVHTHVFGASGCMPNAALAAYKHNLARRLAPEGIRVNLLNPGATETPRMELQNRRTAALAGKSVEEVEAERLSVIPMGRFVTPDDCAKAVLFLVSDLAEFVTGEAINVDGGQCEAIRY